MKYFMVVCWNIEDGFSIEADEAPSMEVFQEETKNFIKQKVVLTREITEEEYKLINHLTLESYKHAN